MLQGKAVDYSSLRIGQHIEQHDQKHERVTCQYTYMPYLVAAKMRREWIRFSVGKDQGADGVTETACDEQRDGRHAELRIDGSDQKNDDPTHQQIADIRNQDRDAGEKNGFEGNKEDRQTPDDAEYDPACPPVEDRQTKRGVRSGDEQVNGIVVENSKDAQIFTKEQKEMQETAEQKGQE